MGFLSNLLNAAGLILLTHAVYSAHEHSALKTSPPTTTTATVPTLTSLPLDITIELLVAVFLTTTGIVISSPGLKPIQWNKWAGKIEREGVNLKLQPGEGVGRNPYGFLEERRGFLDVRAKRKEFADWVREGNKG